MDVSGRKDSAAAVSCCKSFKFVFCVTQDCFLKHAQAATQAPVLALDQPGFLSSGVDGVVNFCQ